MLCGDNMTLKSADIVRVYNFHSLTYLPLIFPLKIYPVHICPLSTLQSCKFCCQAAYKIRPQTLGTYRRTTRKYDASNSTST